MRKGRGRRVRGKGHPVPQPPPRPPPCQRSAPEGPYHRPRVSSVEALPGSCYGAVCAPSALPGTVPHRPEPPPGGGRCRTASHADAQHLRHGDLFGRPPPRALWSARTVTPRGAVGGEGALCVPSAPSCESRSGASQGCQAGVHCVRGFGRPGCIERRSALADWGQTGGMKCSASPQLPDR